MAKQGCAKASKNLITVVDNFLDDNLCQQLVNEFPELKQGERTALPMLSVPAHVEYKIQQILKRCSVGKAVEEDSRDSPAKDGKDAVVIMPGRVAQGSSPMHRDTGFDDSGTPDPGFVKGYVAILYLSGFGTLVVDCKGHEESVDVKPGRLVVWPNDLCLHRLDASPQGGIRKMIGPMSLKESSWQRAGDFFAFSRDGHLDEGPEWARVDAKLKEEDRKAKKERDEKVLLSLNLVKAEGSTLSVSCTDLGGTVVFETQLEAASKCADLRSQISDQLIKDGKIEFEGQLELLHGDTRLDADQSGDVAVWALELRLSAHNSSADDLKAFISSLPDAAKKKLQDALEGVEHDGALGDR
jgi:hypothetical protein